jgi:hypothetical protein
MSLGDTVFKLLVDFVSSQAFVAAPSFTAGEQAALGQAVDVLPAVLDPAVS